MSSPQVSKLESVTTAQGSAALSQSVNQKCWLGIQSDSKTRPTIRTNFKVCPGYQKVLETPFSKIKTMNWIASVTIAAAILI